MELYIIMELDIIINLYVIYHEKQSNKLHKIELYLLSIKAKVNKIQRMSVTGKCYL